MLLRVRQLPPPSHVLCSGTGVQLGWSCQCAHGMRCDGLGLKGNAGCGRLPQLVQGAADAYPAAGLQWGSSTIGTMPRKCCSSMAALPAAVLLLRPAPTLSRLSCIQCRKMVCCSTLSPDEFGCRCLSETLCCGYVGDAFGPQDQPAAERSSTCAGALALALLNPETPVLAYKQILMSRSSN